MDVRLAFFPGPEQGEESEGKDLNIVYSQTLICSDFPQNDFELADRSENVPD